MIIDIEDPILITINSASLDQTSEPATLSFSVTLASSDTAAGTVERVNIRIVNGPQLEPDAGQQAPYDRREYIWSRSFRTTVGTTYYRTTTQKTTFNSTSNNFTGTFPNLANGKYQMIVEVLQLYTGIIYIASTEVTVGQESFNISMSASEIEGNLPFTVEFSSNRIDGSSIGTKKIIWEFEPGVRVQYGDNTEGRNPTYIYKTAGLFVPIVTYILDNGYHISKSLAKTFEEE